MNVGTMSYYGKLYAQQNRRSQFFISGFPSAVWPTLDQYFNIYYCAAVAICNDSTTVLSTRQKIQPYFSSQPKQNAYWKPYPLFIGHFEWNFAVLLTTVNFTMTWRCKLGFIFKSATKSFPVDNRERLLSFLDLE